MNAVVKIPNRKLLMIANVSHWNIIAGDLNVVRVDIVDGKETGVIVGSFRSWEYVVEDRSDEMDD